MNPVIDLLKSHRSIRKFTDQQVDDTVIQQLAEAGQGASSSNHVQAYTIIRVTDPQLREQIQPLAGNQPYITGAPEFWVFCADMKRTTDAIGRAGVEPQMGMMEQLIVATVDATLAAQNVAIAAESLELGICYIGGVRNNPQEISELLTLPTHVYPVFGMCIGYPDQAPDIKPRLPLALVLQENTYNDSNDQALVEQYNADMERYYHERTGGQKSSNWTEGLKPMFAGKLRPHMKDFLFKQGFQGK